MARSCALYRAANLIALDYPFDAALASGLRICDEAVVIVGQSEDDTYQWVVDLATEYPGRVRFKRAVFRYDRMWQERWWNLAASLTDAEWLMIHDADEILPPEHADAVRAQMAEPTTRLIRLPYVHLYGTPNWAVTRDFYAHNVRLGRRSAGFRLANMCTDETPHFSACAMLVQQGGIEMDAHHWTRVGSVTLDAPMLHYGWCRRAHALALSQAKHKAWYADGAGLEDGHLPSVELHNFDMAGQLASGFIARYEGDHPDDLRPWFLRHHYGWSELDAAANAQMRKAVVCHQ